MQIDRFFLAVELKIILIGMMLILSEELMEKLVPGIWQIL